MQRTRECDPQTAKWGHKLDQEINNLKELEIRDEILCGREGHEFHLLSRNPQASGRCGNAALGKHLFRSLLVNESDTRRVTHRDRIA